MDTLAFGYILPATGRIQDFHPLETCAARRTIKRLCETLIPHSLLLLFSVFDLVLLSCNSLDINIGNVLICRSCVLKSLDA